MHDCVVLGKRMGKEIAKLNFQLQPHPQLDADSALASLQVRAADDGRCTHMRPDFKQQ